MGIAKSPTNRSRLIWVGGVWGLIAALALGLVRLVGGQPPVGEETPGNIVFAIIIASPYLIALAATRFPTGVRGPVLLAASLLSLASVVIFIFGGEGVLFLPAAILLTIAAINSFKAGGWQQGLPLALVLVACGAAIIIGSSVASLSAHEDARCWQLIQYKDGRTEWQSVAVRSPEEIRRELQALGLPLPPPEAMIGPSAVARVDPLPEGAVSEGGGCTSDIITLLEAARGMGLLVAGVAGLGALWAGGVERWRLSLALAIAGIGGAVGFGLGLHWAYLIGPLVLLTGNLLSLPFAFRGMRPNP